MPARGDDTGTAKQVGDLCRRERGDTVTHLVPLCSKAAALRWACSVVSAAAVAIGHSASFCLLAAKTGQAGALPKVSIPSMR
ncbi:hypothetical protein SM0020_24795 [Sinorhizobium meliloti CCNWSX0020]|uniref:Uncharacterized protein n=1 Tax=Sinorhizobium meliloti CCNWSX0020 TaxID=1107881 RepID=H0G642_RHIML|nr:hypothetical protein SM0020_24795 [Sinorhizobium meliloti CCNWSX0020]